MLHSGRNWRGFAALIIAGVSQRFVPQVYGLLPPKRDRLKLIFWIMTGSLLLNVTSYLLLLTTYKPVFLAGLEAAYLMMPVWVILLVKQIGIFSRPQQRDRTFKFVRAAFVWLLVSAFMLPLFPLYSAEQRAMWGAASGGVRAPGSLPGDAPKRPRRRA